VDLFRVILLCRCLREGCLRRLDRSNNGNTYAKVDTFRLEIIPEIKE